MSSQQLGTLLEGTIIQIRENNVLQDFIVGQHNYQSSGRTLLIRRQIFDFRRWNNTWANNQYSISEIDSFLNTSYLDLLPTDLQTYITEINIPSTVGGNTTAMVTDSTVVNILRRVFLLSLAEMNRSHAQVSVEGIPLPDNVISMLFALEQGPWWLRSPNNVPFRVTQSDGAGHARVCLISNNTFSSTASPGQIQNSGGQTGSRPSFTVPPSLPVLSNGELVTNVAPVINHSGSTDFGELTEGVVVEYSVSDDDGDVVTVTERLNGVIQRTFTPELDTTQSFQTVLPQNFQTIPNGNYTMRIEATDGRANAVPVEITFSKSIFSASITLSEPMAADAMPTAITMRVRGNIPDDAVWSAEVCNNANDANPTWEDITSAVQDNMNHIFANTTSTSGTWSVNFRLNLARGASNVGGYITSIEGGFE